MFHTRFQTQFHAGFSQSVLFIHTRKQKGKKNQLSVGNSHGLALSIPRTECVTEHVSKTLHVQRLTASSPICTSFYVAAISEQ